jgi:phospholipase/lecithinase/hemolysin
VLEEEKVMKVPRYFRFLLLVLVLAGGLPLAAGPFTTIYFFGDSLSDTGNAFIGTGFTYPPSPPYFEGRLSNGPVWVEDFAAALGVPGASVPFLAGGQNLAVGGANTGLDGVVPGTGVLTQVGLFLGTAGGPLDPGALYVMAAGGNDIREAALIGDPVARAQRVGAAVQDYMTAIGALAAAGAQRFLIGNAFDMGLTPEAILVRGNAAEATQSSLLFNALLQDALQQFLLVSPQSTVRLLDIFSLGHALVVDALVNGGAVYGITNVTTPCFPGFAGSPGADCGTSLFADDLHPTRRVHMLLADRALASVPEPGTWAMLVIGLGLGGWYRRSRRRA